MSTSSDDAPEPRREVVTVDYATGFQTVRAATPEELRAARARIESFLANEAKRSLAENIYQVLMQPVRQASRTENADLRRLHRERLLDGLYGVEGSTYSRPCAACGLPGPWFVCLRCSTGVPGLSPWRIKPEAAARIRTKMYARRYDEPLPLPGSER